MPFKALVEMEFDGRNQGWTDVSEDVIGTDTIMLKYGIDGHGMNDRVASPGNLRFSLRNGDSASQGAGSYSPGHSNARSGFALGARARLSFNVRSDAYQDNIIATPDLQAYWRLGEQSGTTAVDTSGNGFDGTYSGTLTLGAEGAPPVRGDDTGVLIDAGRVLIGDVLDQTSSFSLECWCKPNAIAFANAVDGAALIHKDDGSSNGSWSLTLNNGICTFLLRGSNPETLATSAIFGKGKWYHVVAVLDASLGDWRIYVNNVLAAQDTIGPVQADIAALLTLGNSAGATMPFDGILDEVAIYDRALTADEVSEHYGRHFYKFVGPIVSIRPTPGENREQRTNVIVTDWIDEASNASIGQDVPIQIDQRFDQIVNTIIDNMTIQPAARQVAEEGQEVYPYALDTARSDSSSVLTELQRLAKSEGGYIYLKGDEQQGGTLVIEGRISRGRTFDNAINITQDQIIEMMVESARDSVVTQAQTVIHPKRTDAAAVVLYTLRNAQEVASGATQLIIGNYKDPQQLAARVGGFDMVSPVATTDYTANSQEDGAGTDLTSNISIGPSHTDSHTDNHGDFHADHSDVDHADAHTDTHDDVAHGDTSSPSFGGDGFRAEITNTGSQTAFLTSFQVRGKGIYDFENVVSETVAEDVVGNVGLRRERLDMPYQPDLRVGNEMSAFLAQVFGDVRAQVRAVTIRVDEQETESMLSHLAREVSDRVGIEETQTGTTNARGFFIQGVAIEVLRGDCGLEITYTLQPADTAQYWILEQEGASELGISTRLAFFVSVGHTDIAHDDLHLDTAHSDVAHSDTHTDTHDDSHTDTGHGDAGHSDTHTDTHGDALHSDTHTDVAHTDTGHSDVGHNDSHSDIAHSDIAHQDSHTDVASHSDLHDDSHLDKFTPHSDIHTDSHTDTAHSDSHGDVSHSDTPHGDDAHSDSHSDVNHSDTHTDLHADTAHTDAAHVDTHSDTHSDVAHSDSAHVDISHSDTHEDIAHGDA